MKLKFDEEVQAVISAIVQLPDTETDEELLSKPSNLIADFDRHLIRQRDTKAMAMKKWVKLRRQLSFLFEFVYGAFDAGKKLRDPAAPNVETQAGKEETYRVLVHSIKGIVDGRLLRNPGMVRLAMGYGVLYLSDHEIKLLIENNKKEQQDVLASLSRPQL
jgi:hypothetical protein